MSRKKNIAFGKDGPICASGIAEHSLIVIPPRNARFTKEEWYLNNDMRMKNAVDQQQIAERVLGECQRIKGETEERTKTNKETTDRRECQRIKGETEERTKANKETTDRRFLERIGDIEFNKGELELQRGEVCLELEALDVYKLRLIDCLNSLQENALNQCKKCIILRERRVGVDLVVDEVGMALQNEINVIFGGQELLKKALEQTNEQMRRLRATRYAIDHDLEHKEHSVRIDKASSCLKHSDHGLAVYEGFSDLDPANITKEEWEKYSATNIIMAAKEITSARPIRVMIDTLLKQVYEDLVTANSICNRAFKNRIEETKKAKEKLEGALSQTIIKVDEMMENIYSLEKALSDKLGYIALAHTRMGKRAQRPGAELVKDAVCNSLRAETEMLRASKEDLVRVLEEANASLRYLLQIQIQLEEDINVKINSLKIDEVECLTIRDGMEYHLY